MNQRVCSTCFKNCNATFLQCPHCNFFSRCFVEKCYKKPSHCIGAFFLLCQYHVSLCSGVNNAQPQVKKIFALPPPLIEIENKGPVSKKGTLISFKKKRQFNLPDPKQVRSLIHTVKHAMRYSIHTYSSSSETTITLDDIKAANTLQNFK